MYYALVQRYPGPSNLRLQNRVWNPRGPEVCCCRGCASPSKVRDGNTRGDDEDEVEEEHQRREEEDLADKVGYRS
jgi:hypothetical protein